MTATTPTDRWEPVICYAPKGDLAGLRGEWWISKSGKTIVPTKSGTYFAIAYMDISMLGDVLGVEVRLLNPIPRPGGAITTQVVRALNVDSMRRALLQSARRMASTSEHDQFRERGKAITWAASRPGRAGRTDLDYARAAQVYVNKLGSATPAEDAARELTISPSQLRNVLYEARRRSLLTAAPSGRAGGALTEAALRLLSPKAD